MEGYIYWGLGDIIGGMRKEGRKTREESRGRWEKIRIIKCGGLRDSEHLDLSYKMKASVLQVQRVLQCYIIGHRLNTKSRICL